MQINGVLRFQVRFLGSFLMVAPLAVALAQSPPDAGSLLRSQPTPSITPAPTTRPAVVPEAELPDSGPKVRVQGFHLSGAVLIGESELQEHLKPAIGSELSLGQLKGLAASLVALYAQRGYLARIVLPPQDIKDGIVELRIVEGRRGSLRIDSQDTGLDGARIERFIDQRLGANQAMNIAQLGEALNILNDQPGLNVRSIMVPGKQEGDVDLVVQAAAQAPVSFFVGVNNQGTRATGEWQGNASATLVNPSGHFDSLSVLANTTQGTSFGRLDYSLSIGDRGLRVGAHAARLNYHVIQEDFSALDSHGSAGDYGIAANYPLAQRSDFALRLDFKHDEKRLLDLTAAGEIGNRHVHANSMGISGHAAGTAGNLLGQGVLSFGTSVVLGSSEQDNAGALALDALTRRVDGRFNKLDYNLGYLVPLSDTWSLNTTLRGQVADKNLDSSERISLGGPTGVRAYPMSEGTGDEGWIVSINFDQKVRDNLVVRYFMDAGGVTLNRQLWDGWNTGSPDQLNRYNLAGGGIGVDWRIDKHKLINAFLAVPIGSNPGRDAQDHNVNGRPDGARSWLNFIAQF